MNYQIIKKNGFLVLTIAEGINNVDWKDAKYLANKMKSNEFNEWRGVVIAVKDDRIVDFLFVC